LNPGVGVTNDTNIPCPTIGTVSYNQGAAGSVAPADMTDKDAKDYMVQDIVITLPTNADGSSAYTNVGEYYYTITEDAPPVAGVTYHSTEIILVVTVIQNGDNEQVRVAAVHCETPMSPSYDNPSTKSDDITNTYSAGKFSINKQVTGNLGDRNQYFEVTVSFESEKPVNAPIYYYGGSYSSGDGDVGGYGAADNKEIAVNVGGFTKEDGENVYKATATIKVKDNDTVYFDNIPYGVTYTVTETDYTDAADGDNKLGYDTPSIKVDKADAIVDHTVNSYIGTKTITDEEGNSTSETNVDDVIVITNNKSTDVDTGIALDSAPYFLMLAVALFGMVALVSKKRHEV